MIGHDELDVMAGEVPGAARLWGVRWPARDEKKSAPTNRSALGRELWGAPPLRISPPAHLNGKGTGWLQRVWFLAGCSVLSGRSRRRLRERFYPSSPHRTSYSRTGSSMLHAALDSSVTSCVDSSGESVAVDFTE